MKDIAGYKGLYAITSCGKVWSYKRQRFLKASITGRGYLTVQLCKNGKRETRFIHRLVAEAYIPNPKNKKTINHKDECKINNYINNLEWMTYSENNNYGTRNEKVSKKVMCVETGEIFNSLREAGRKTGINNSSISRCCSGISLKTAGKYHWQYV